MSSGAVGRSIAEQLQLGALPEHELVTIVVSRFPSGSWDGEGRDVHFLEHGGEPAVTVRHDGRGDLIDIVAGPALTADLLAELADLVAETIAGAGESLVERFVLFSQFPCDGFWRFEDSWQIVPAPEGAPRPGC
jgi:hypothetical protein